MGGAGSNELFSDKNITCALHWFVTPWCFAEHVLNVPNIAHVKVCSNIPLFLLQILVSLAFSHFREEKKEQRKDLELSALQVFFTWGTVSARISACSGVLRMPCRLPAHLLRLRRSRTARWRQLKFFYLF